MKKQENYCNFIEKKVLTHIRQQDMLCQGETVLLGVSGGADSVCLLVILCALAGELGIKLHVAHVNHGVREEAEADSRYVEKLCRELGVPFSLQKIHMNALAEEWKCSSEEAGRKARYAFFEELGREIHAGKIAVAHNMGDCSETMLFHLFRGSGLSGLSGIRPVRGRIIRPLLCLERREIEEYLRQKGISYCHAKTNDEDTYTRNRIRHHILPYAEAEIVTGTTRNIYEAARHIAQMQDFLEAQTEQLWGVVVLYEGNTRVELDVREMVKLHEVLQKEILRKVVGMLAGGCKDITREHIDSLYFLMQEEGNRQVYLPYHIRGERSYERLLVYVAEEKKASAEEINIDKETLNTTPVQYTFAGTTLELCVRSYDGNMQDIPQNQYTKWLDYDKIKGILKIRHRINGDYFSVKNGDGMGRKKLKDYLIDEKVPRQMREQIPLIAEEHHVLWLIPYRISEYFKVSSQTRKILQITVKEHNGGTYGETQS